MHGVITVQELNQSRLALQHRRQQVTERQEQEQQWLDEQHRYERNKLIDEQLSLNEEHSRVKQSMLTERHEAEEKWQRQWDEQQQQQQHIDRGAAMATVAIGRQSALVCSTASTADPDAFLCPISHVRMIDPIVASDGQTYDRFSAFSAIDSRANMPGCHSGSFKILGELPGFPDRRNISRQTCNRHRTFDDSMVCLL